MNEGQSSHSRSNPARPLGAFYRGSGGEPEDRLPRSPANAAACLPAKAAAWKTRRAGGKTRERSCNRQAAQRSFAALPWLPIGRSTGRAAALYMDRATIFTGRQFEKVKIRGLGDELRPNSAGLGCRVNGRFNAHGNADCPEAHCFAIQVRRLETLTNRTPRRAPGAFTSFDSTFGFPACLLINALIAVRQRPVTGHLSPDLGRRIHSGVMRSILNALGHLQPIF